MEDEKTIQSNTSISDSNGSDTESEKGIHNSSNLNSSQIDADTREKLRGDAIGDTMYSESFIIKTLMQLSETTIHWCTELEDDLCFVWDATMEQDVCNFLIKLAYPNIVASVIQSSEEARLIEIVIGVLANICSVRKDANIVKEPVIDTVLTMVVSDDPLILIQVSRFLKAISYNLDKLSFITESLLERFNFILTNSTNNELLLNTLDALSKITSYEKINISLINDDLINSSCVAYNTLCNNMETKINCVAFTHLLQIVSNISTYINESSNKIEPSLRTSVNKTIHIFVIEVGNIFSYYSKQENLLPLEEDLVHIVDVLVPVFQILDISYCSEVFNGITSILSILIKHDWEDIDIFVELVCYHIAVGSPEVIINDLNKLTPKIVLPVFNKIKQISADYEFNYISNFNWLCKNYQK